MREWIQKPYSILWDTPTLQWPWTITHTPPLTAHKRNFSDWRLKGKEMFYYFFTTFQSKNTSRFKKYVSISRYTKYWKYLKQQAIPDIRTFEKIVKNHIRVYIKLLECIGIRSIDYWFQIGMSGFEKTQFGICDCA